MPPTGPKQRTECHSRTCSNATAPGVKYCTTQCARDESRARSKDRRGICKQCHGPVLGVGDICSERCAGSELYAAGRMPNPPGDAAAASVASINLSQQLSPGADDFVRGGWAHLIDSGARTQAAVAIELGTTQRSVSAWYNEYRETHKAAVTAAQFEVAPDHAAALSDFPTFRSLNFAVPDVRGHVLQGVRYATPPFQQRWGLAIDHILENPGILIILAPPRHGKSEFLAHKVIQLVVRQPNIRCMWVGGNEDIANQSVEQVRDELGNNNELRDHYLAPGASFRPPARLAGSSWKSGRFTVATRNVTGIKSPTLLAVGKGGKILSRDADLIVVDDIVDHASTRTEGNRKDDWQWFRTQLMSRREPHTSVVVIGSRQHFADIYSHLLQDEAVTAIVDTAHNEAVCRNQHPTSEPGATSNCLLFPELRSYDWLKGQEHALGRELYEMVYLNKPRSSASAMFEETAVKAARNYARPLGPSRELPVGLRLVAGLDPATKGYQAAFLWGADVATERQYAIDLDNTKGAGIPGFLDIAKQWLDAYGLRLWVLEDNAAQHAYLQDREVRAWAAENGVVIRGHHTGANKWDPNLGVSALSRLFARGLIDLPYGDGDAIAKMDAYIGQLLSFEAGPVSRTLSDLVMASWFPQPVMRSWRSEHLASAAQERDPDYPWDAPSLPDPYARIGA